MITKLAKMALAVGSSLMTIALLCLMADVGDADKKYSPLVILAFLTMLGIIAVYTYTRFFDEGVIFVPKIVQWVLVTVSGIVILLIYAIEYSSRINGVTFNRLAPIPGFLAFLYALTVVIALGGDAFLGPIRSIVRLGQKPNESK